MKNLMFEEKIWEIGKQNNGFCLGLVSSLGENFSSLDKIRRETLLGLLTTNTNVASKFGHLHGRKFEDC